MNMKYLLLFLLLASTQAMYSQTELMDWGNETTEEKSKEGVVKQYDFSPQWLDNKFVISGKMDIPGKSAHEIFQLLLSWIADIYPQADKVVVKIDGEGKRLLVNTVYFSKEFTFTESFYRMKIVFQAKDSELHFQQFDFEYNALGGALGLKYKKYPFEEMFPNLIPDKRKNVGYLNEVLKLNNEHLSTIRNDIYNKKTYLEVSHYDEINKKIPSLGMNRTECILSMGKPEKINFTILDGKQLEQWVYSIDKYVYFDNGTLYSMQF